MMMTTSRGSDRGARLAGGLFHSFSSPARPGPAGPDPSVTVIMMGRRRTSFFFGALVRISFCFCPCLILSFFVLRRPPARPPAHPHPSASAASISQVLDLGCNAVLAYQQDFDVEGDSGIVARAYGTACVIQRREHQHQLADKVTEISLTRRGMILLCRKASSTQRTQTRMFLAVVCMVSYDMSNFFLVLCRFHHHRWN